MSLTFGATPHLLLGVACAEPQTRSEMQDCLARRGVMVEDSAARAALDRLTERGFLCRERRRFGGGHPSYVYALTPAGEDMLDQMVAIRPEPPVARLTHAERVLTMLDTMRPLTLAQMARGLGTTRGSLSVTLSEMHHAGRVCRVNRHTREPSTAAAGWHSAWERAQ